MRALPWKTGQQPRGVCCVAETSEDSDAEGGKAGMNTSDKEDPSGATNLLAGLSTGQLTVLRATRSESPHPAPLAYAASIECAVNPWMDAAGVSSGQMYVAHEFVQGIGSDEHKAQRSLMHRCALQAAISCSTSLQCALISAPLHSPVSQDEPL